MTFKLLASDWLTALSVTVMLAQRRVIPLVRYQHFTWLSSVNLLRTDAQNVFRDTALCV